MRTHSMRERRMYKSDAKDLRLTLAILAFVSGCLLGATVVLAVIG
jgi:hypothetical protein